MQMIGVHCHRRVIMIIQQLAGSRMTGDGWPMNTFNNEPEKWAQEIEIKIKEQPVKLQRDQRWNCAVIVLMETIRQCKLWVYIATAVSL